MKAIRIKNIDTVGSTGWEEAKLNIIVETEGIKLANFRETQVRARLRGGKESYGDDKKHKKHTKEGEETGGTVKWFAFFCSQGRKAVLRISHSLGLKNFA